MLTVFVTYHYFLGLRTLTVIQNAEKLIQTNRDKNFDIRNIDYDDVNVYNYIGTGKTDGIFQLESAGMKNFMKELKPRNLEDVIAGISLYRPGPMDFIPKYIRGKENADSVTYDCPQLEPILSPTYGCIVYQEQVMQIVRDLAGYSYGRSDLVRRAMSKKKQSVMEQERKNFVYGNEEEGVVGCIANGISEEVAHKVFSEMMDFAKYAFNKSHAAAYAVVSYQTAYLKHYYPVEFMAALMTSVIENPSKVSMYIYVCRQMGIKILPPDINSGYGVFSVDGNNIRYGLSAIKGLGMPVIDAIVKERESNGKFTSLKDFANRLSAKEVNKRTIDSLIKSGALDDLKGNRRQKIQVYTAVIDSVNEERKNSMTGQISLFDFVDEETKESMEIQYPNVPEFDKATLLAMEKEVLGVYVSGHPLEEYEKLMSRNITNTSLDFNIDNEENDNIKDKQECTVGGMIVSKNVMTTSRNSVMAFVTLEDMYGNIEVIVFPKQYERLKNMLNQDAKVFIQGRLSIEEEKAPKLILSRLIPFEDIKKDVYIRCSQKSVYMEKLEELGTAIAESDGKDRIIVVCVKENEMKILGDGMTIRADEETLGKLKAIFGENNVGVKEGSL